MTPAASRANAAAGSEPKRLPSCSIFGLGHERSGNVHQSSRQRLENRSSSRQRLENRSPRDSDWRTGRSRSRAPMKKEGTSPAPAQKLRSCVPASLRSPPGSQGVPDRGTIGGRSAPWSWWNREPPRAPPSSPLACKTLHRPSVAICRCGAGLSRFAMGRSCRGLTEKHMAALRTLAGTQSRPKN